MGAAKRCASTMVFFGAYKLWEETHREKLGIYSYSMVQRKISQKNGLEAPKFSVSMLNWWRATRRAQSQVQISRRSFERIFAAATFCEENKTFLQDFMKDGANTPNALDIYDFKLILCQFRPHRHNACRRHRKISNDSCMR